MSAFELINIKECCSPIADIDRARGELSAVDGVLSRHLLKRGRSDQSVEPTFCERANLLEYVGEIIIVTPPS